MKKISDKQRFLLKSENIEVAKYNKILVSAFERHGMLAEGAKERWDDLLLHFFHDDNKELLLGLMYDACNPEIGREKKLEVGHQLLNNMPGILVLIIWVPYGLSQKIL